MHETYTERMDKILNGEKIKGEKMCALLNEYIIETDKCRAVFEQTYAAFFDSDCHLISNGKSTDIEKMYRIMRNLVPKFDQIQINEEIVETTMIRFPNNSQPDAVKREIILMRINGGYLISIVDDSVLGAGLLNLKETAKYVKLLF